MILVPTRVCDHGRCAYCTVEKRDAYPFFLHSPDLGTLIDRLSALESIQPSGTLRFFWGEPLIAFSFLERFIPLLSDRISLRLFLNSSLRMLEDRHIAFFRKHAVQIITTYNGTIEDHTLTRSLPIDDARRILAHLELLIQQGLAPHINLVITPETAERLTENIAFLAHHGIRHIRLLPMHFIGWSHDALASLTHGLAQAKQWLEQNQGAVSLLNNRTPTPIPLFLSEWVIDSDGGIYTNMIILESFFRDEKKHIQVSSLQKNQDDFEQDIHSFDPEHSKLHEAFIARTLAEKFAPISSSESTMSKLFHEFITSLPACVFSHP